MPHGPFFQTPGTSTARAWHPPGGDGSEEPRNGTQHSTRAGGRSAAGSVAERAAETPRSARSARSARSSPRTNGHCGAAADRETSGTETLAKHLTKQEDRTVPAGPRPGPLGTLRARRLRRCPPPSGGKSGPAAPPPPPPADWLPAPGRAAALSE